MRDSLHSYMRVGIVHFMAFPETIRGEGPILETISKIAEDDFFSAIEVTSIKDPGLRDQVARLLQTSGLAVGFGAQPLLLMGKHDLNSLDEEKRVRAVEAIKAAVDEAYLLGSERLAVLSGPDPGPDRRTEAIPRLVKSLNEIGEYAESKGKLGITLEVFDREIDKKCLIGSTAEAVAVAREVRRRFPSFGLMIDLSHLPMQGETAIESLSLAKDYLVHTHIGNCVIKDKAYPAYGDSHPRFGLPGGENGAEELRDFLQALFEVGYLREGTRNYVAFEVKPQPGETSAAVIANAKRTLTEAWARL